MTDKKERGKKSRKQGRTAQLMVQVLFDSWGWEAREDVPDEGYDFNVEIPSDATSPAHRILVQVKSSDEISVRRDGSWSVPLRRSRLNEYRRHRLPVFVIGVDLATEAFRWCAADDEGAVAPPKLNVRKRGARKTKSAKVYLRLIEGRSLTKTRDDAFVAAIGAAWQRRNDLYHPPAIAARVREDLLRKKDPRFDVAVNVVDGKELRIIQARDQPVSLSASMLFQNKDAAESFQNTYRFGTPSTVKTMEFQITGSALFEDLPTSGEISVGAHPQRRRLLFGYLERSTTSAVKWQIEEDGELFVGAEGGEWQMDCPKLPLRIRMRIDHKEGLFYFNFTLDRSAWLGADLRRLPYFDAFRQLVDGALASGAISIATRVLGEVHAIAEVPVEGERQLLESISSWLRYILALKKICQWANASVHWQEESVTNVNQMGNWILGARLIDGERPASGPESVTLVCEESMLANIERMDGPFVLRTALEIEDGSVHVTDVPVLMTLSNYQVRRGDAPGDVVISRTEGSAAVIQLDPAPDQVPSISLFGA